MYTADAERRLHCAGSRLLVGRRPPDTYPETQRTYAFSMSKSHCRVFSSHPIYVTSISVDSSSPHLDVDDLRGWAWDDFLDNTTSHLTEIGFQELFQLGRRLKNKYPNLISDDLGKFYFRSTAEQRTVASAEAFVEGLTGAALGAGGALVDMPRPDDAVIRPYKMCLKYEEIKNTYPTAEDHVKEFYRTTEFQLMVQDVEERIGLRNELTPKKIIALYDLCRFYRSFEISRRSPWCAIFSDANLVTLEYIDDIRHFYKNGYGSEINCQLGTTALKVLFERFEAVYDGVGKNFVGYFTHDTMMEMVFCAMGLFRDDFNVTGAVRWPTRKWRTSLISPFATNLIAVMYKCTTARESVAERMVQFFHNERELAVCAGGACSWEQFEDKFRVYANATLEFCEPSDDSSPDSQKVLYPKGAKETSSLTLGFLLIRVSVRPSVTGT
ncbi:Multiple inositol polyphosphate phosphatase 1 [Eumeta japonica]|uniref:Multiple inositol polyphosphate phosphatase 1 n=1 Tax=Eumeta variegata TaxID=151549 RepID=A0A4C1VDJ4_EUMVA|nr:Multiple inositol polyphosphate phosphatase 1 [Eumeta japonica]